ncbi:hypothetical protein ACJX0J_006905 [Zea mays]
MYNFMVEFTICIAFDVAECHEILRKKVLETLDPIINPSIVTDTTQFTLSVAGFAAAFSFHNGFNVLTVQSNLGNGVRQSNLGNGVRIERLVDRETEIYDYIADVIHLTTHFQILYYIIDTLNKHYVFIKNYYFLAKTQLCAYIYQKPKSWLHRRPSQSLGHFLMNVFMHFVVNYKDVWAILFFFSFKCIATFY